MELFIVNGRIHVNRAIYNNTDFSCQLLGRTSLAFTVRLIPLSSNDFGRPPSCEEIRRDHPNAPIDCFFPGVLDAHRTYFSLETKDNFAVHRLRTSQNFVLEFLCQPCALTEDDPWAYYTANR